MTTYLDVDIDKFKAKGGVVCGDDDFVVVTLSCCGHQCLYNEEILHLYTDPDDLSKRYFLSNTEATPRCPNCGSEEWEFDEYGIPLERVAQGVWAWVLKSPG